MKEFLGKIFFIILVVICIFYTCIAFWVSSGVFKIEKESKKQDSLRIERIKQAQRDSDIDDAFSKVH